MSKISICGLRINSKSPLFYTLISVIILTILTIIAISIKLSFSNAAGEVEGANDTAIATLNNVDILQAGTGQSVTIKGETLNENDYGPDNATRRTILNNNIVRYNANYNVTKVGQITFSITLPANNTIDEATIAESQGCLPNLSKLESADITNSDGTITKSYTNNKAICVRNIATTGSTNWQITAYLWGSNNTKIQPTLAVSGQTSTVKPEEISVVGKPNYKLYITTTSYNPYSQIGYNLSAALDLSLYIPISETGVVGISPISAYSVILDMANMPTGWAIYDSKCGPRQSLDHGITSGFAYDYKDYVSSCEQTNDRLQVRIDNIVTAIPNYSKAQYDGYAYITNGIRFAIPTSSLSYVGDRYSIAIQGLAWSNGDSFSIDTINTVTYYLSSAGSAISRIQSGLITGWASSYTTEGPLYTGQYTNGPSLIATTKVLDKSYSNNVNICIAWSGDEYSIGEITKSIDGAETEYGVADLDEVNENNGCGTVGDSKTNRTFFADYNEAKLSASDADSSINAIRIHIDRLANGTNSKIVNLPITVRKPNISKSEETVIYSYVTSDDWVNSTSPDVFKPILTPGLLSHTLTAIPSSTNPGKEDHITITTKTYNKDTDSKITINLPNGLTPKEGSFTITTGYTHNDVTNTNEPIKAVLIEGENQDYTITANGSSSAGNVSYAITLDLDHIASTHHVPITGYDPIYPGESGVTNIAWNDESSSWQEVITTNNNNEDSNINNDDLPIAADNNGNGISHISTPIEFDVTVNEDTPSPSTLTINSTASGTGTDYASTTFKTTSDTIAVAEPPKTFGYDLTASSNNIYAGDDLTYSYSISNTTSSNTNDITMITVLPFNGDSRGTTGLKNLEEETTQASSSSSTTSNPSTITNPYTISNLSLSLPSDGVSGLDTSATKLYYTLDPKAHELESNPETLALDSSITWQELELDSDGNIPTDIMTNLQQQGVLDSITALKLTNDELPSGSQLKLTLTLDNILATTSSAKAILANDITYLSYASETNQAVEQVAEQTVEGTTNTNTKTVLRREGNTTTYSNGQIVSVHQNPVKVNYLGELLALSIPEGEQTIQVDLDLNDVVIGNPDTNDDSANPVNHLSLTTATLRGYTLTAQASTENGALVAEGDPLRLIPSIATKPTKDTAGWSANIAGSNNPTLGSLTSPTESTTWTAIPGSNQTPLNLYASAAKGRDSRNLTVTYGFSAANTIADTYSARMVYTVTAGL